MPWPYAHAMKARLVDSGRCRSARLPCSLATVRPSPSADHVLAADAVVHRDVHGLVAQVVRHGQALRGLPLGRLSLTKSVLHTSLTLVVMFSGVRSVGGLRTFLRLRSARLPSLYSRYTRL